MSLLSTLLAIASAVGFFALIMYVLFGQITVRKLRKNPELRHALGLELVSGWDIINVAQALATPKVIMKKLSKTPLAAAFANAELLKKHTNKFDRVLGTFFYSLLMFSGLSFAALALFDMLGFFD